MNTYDAVREYGRKHYGVTIQNCWIAHRKEENGVAINSRRVGPRVKPCPQKHAAMVDSVLRQFGVIGASPKER
jgi:hypothetical protein